MATFGAANTIRLPPAAKGLQKENFQMKDILGAKQELYKYFSICG